MPDASAAARLFRHARREAVVVLVLWAVALVWTVGYCYLRGYQHSDNDVLVRWGWAASRSADDFGQVLGFPDWVFVGIILPWLACTAFTMVYSMVGLTDDDLGAEAEEEQSPREGIPPAGGQS